jgi:chromate reductase
MTATPRILAFAGSSRRESFNKRLVPLLAAGARSAGAEVTELDLRDFPMPLYDGDLEKESGLPEHARRMRELFRAHHGLLLACPEYNSSITGLLKNTLDWVSRDEQGRGSIAPFEGKVAGLASASPGALGGLRGLVHVRAILGNLKVLVVPEQVAVPKAHEAFDESGSPKDAKQRAALENVGAAVARLVARLLA